MKEALAVIGVLVLIVGGIVGISVGVRKASCGVLSRDTGINTKYTFFSGCLVEVNGRYIPRENWRGEYQQ